MSRNQEFILAALEKRRGSMLSIDEIATAISCDTGEVFSGDQVEFSMTGLRRNRLVIRSKVRGPTGVPVFKYSVDPK